jgi:4-diphosphocytidyl-2-C-methyl-D-erythritol kinase
MMKGQNYRAPSKINAFLAVNGRDSIRDLHKLTSFFWPLDLCDELSITHREHIEIDNGQKIPVGTASGKKWSYKISVNGDEAPLISDQILDKVFRLWSENYSLMGNYGVYLKKKIPLQSGLGGGSSDAAVLLRFLNNKKPISSHDLVTLALRCGSDVPFFLQPKPSIVRNFGEEMERLDIFDPNAIRGQSWLLFKPSCGISTAEAYRRMAQRASEFYLSEKETEERLKESLQSFVEKDSRHWLFYNSFQKLFEERFPGIAPLLHVLEAMHYACGMSGSGSAWFIPLESGDDGREAVRQIRNHLGSAVWMSKVSGWSSM